MQLFTTKSILLTVVSFATVLLTFKANAQAPIQNGSSTYSGNLFHLGGNLGIGNSNPSERLDLSGNLRMRSYNSKLYIPFRWNITDQINNKIVFQTGWSSAHGDYLFLKNPGGSSQANTMGLRLATSSGFEIGKNNFNSKFFKITPWGKVGVGVNNPDEAFTVRGNIKQTTDWNKLLVPFRWFIEDHEHNKVIIETGWNSWNGDYLVLNNPGSTLPANSVSFRLGTNTGLQFGTNNLATKLFQINKQGKVIIGSETIASGPHNTSNVKLTVDGHALFRKVAVAQLIWQ